MSPLLHFFAQQSVAVNIQRVDIFRVEESFSVYLKNFLNFFVSKSEFIYLVLGKLSISLNTKECESFNKLLQFANFIFLTLRVPSHEFAFNAFNA